jgi:hypothetical protein
MPINIVVTKVACAYVELEKDTPTTINADLIKGIIPSEPGIGSAIIFFRDGTTMNTTETVVQIVQRLNERKQYFQREFSKN